MVWSCTVPTSVSIKSRNRRTPKGEARLDALLKAALDLQGQAGGSIDPESLKE
jgi:hypothetical protein